ncbi:hypothetical protein [Streptomyces viridosporus]
MSTQNLLFLLLTLVALAAITGLIGYNVARKENTSPHGHRPQKRRALQ